MKKRNKLNGFLHEINRNKTLYLMFVPVAVYFLAFCYLPMAGIVVAFKEFNYRDGLFLSPWNHFKNFEYFFKSGKAMSVTKNTIMFNVIFLTLYTLFSIIVAILISEVTNKLFKKITQTMLLLPYFISWVVVGSLMYNFFNYDYGIVNTMLQAIGMEKINIYTNTGPWYILLPFLYVWKWVGYGSVLYLSAIMGIDQECYEAAYIDGASRWQRITRITLPLLKPTAITLILLGVGRIMRGEFDMFYQIIGSNGLLMDATDIIDTLVFRSLVGTQDFGMASAAAFYQSVLCFIIILIVNGIARKVDKDYALF